jgi:hypothetical protein
MDYEKGEPLKERGTKYLGQGEGQEGGERGG